MGKMRVFLVGCGTISVEMLRILVKHKSFEVVGVASKDHLEEMRVWHEMGELSLAEEAMRCDIPIYATNNVNSIEKELQELSLDYIFCGSWSHLFKRRVLKIPRIGCFNIHPSLLPKNRGCMPVHWAIIEGNLTGVTIHKMAAGADNGAIVKQVRYIIPLTMNVKTLTKILWSMGIKLFKECLDSFVNETFTLTLQDEGLATHHPKGLPYGGVMNPDWSDDVKNKFRRAMDYPPFDNLRE